MTKLCCVPTCRLRSESIEGLSTTFHVLPTKQTMRNKWIQELKAKFVDLALPKYVYVCSKHFQSDCFYYTGMCKNIRLKAGSYPSIFSRLENTNLEKNVEANSQLMETTDSGHDSISSYSSLRKLTEDSTSIDSSLVNVSMDSSLPIPNILTDSNEIVNISADSEQVDVSTNSEESDVDTIKALKDKLTSNVLKSTMKANIDITDLMKLDKAILCKLYQNAMVQLSNSEQKRKALQSKIYRWKKRMQSTSSKSSKSSKSSLLLHLKEHNYISKRVVCEV